MSDRIITLIHPLTGAEVLLDTQTGRIVPPVATTQEPWHVVKAREVYRTIEAFGWDVTWRSSTPVPDDAWPIDVIARALLDARERPK
jgi:hypothetical protein